MSSSDLSWKHVSMKQKSKLQHSEKALTKFSKVRSTFCHCLIGNRSKIVPVVKRLLMSKDSGLSQVSLIAAMIMLSLDASGESSKRSQKSRSSSISSLFGEELVFR